jgi:hypothetical protein
VNSLETVAVRAFRDLSDITDNLTILDFDVVSLAWPGGHAMRFRARDVVLAIDESGDERHAVVYWFYRQSQKNHTNKTEIIQHRFCAKVFWLYTHQEATSRFKWTAPDRDKFQHGVVCEPIDNALDLVFAWPLSHRKNLEPVTLLSDVDVNRFKHTVPAFRQPSHARAYNDKRGSENRAKSIRFAIDSTLKKDITHHEKGTKPEEGYEAMRWFDFVKDRLLKAGTPPTHFNNAEHMKISLVA